MLKDYIRKKIIRLQGSQNVFKLNYLYHSIFGEKNNRKIGLDFSKKPTRTKIVQETISRKRYKSFLEIGSFHNELFDHIKCEKKVGVDPYSGGTIRKTSNDFFSENEESFDLIFIDGLHTYYQVKKDILNSLKVLNSGGVIMLHDCLPNNFYEQAVPRCQDIWNGDVWKAIVEIRTLNNLDTYTCFADHGLGIIFRRMNKNLLDIKIKNFKELKFKDYYYNQEKFMNIISVEELYKLI